MQRINSTNRAVNKFGAGKDGFHGGSPATGVKATYLTAEWANSVQEELVRAIEGAGIVLDAAKYDQLLAAIKTIAWGAGKEAPSFFRGRLSTTNINTFFDLGAWQQNLSANATLENGYPFVEAGLLENYPWGANAEDIVQRYTSFFGDKFAIRTYYKSQNKLSSWSIFDANKIAPINSPFFTGSPSTPTPALFDTSAAIANMSAVQSAKGSYNYLRGLHTGQITEAMLGNAIQVAGNVTLPGCTSKHAGAAVTLFATANATVSVSNPAVDFIYEPGLLGLQNTTRSITLAPGEEVVLSNRGGAEWNVVGGNLVATRLCARKTDADNTYLRKDSTFTNWYPSHYAGAQVFVSKQAKLKIQTIKIDNINKTGIFNLPEGFDGVWDVTATDRGSGKFPIGITVMNNNQFQLWSDCPSLFVTVTAIGFAN